MTVEQLQDRLTTQVYKLRLISISKDGQLYGTVNDSSARIELGQSCHRNSFRPVVVFKWTKTNSTTEITGYYRIALSVLLTTLFIPLFGLYLTIEIKNILPVVFLSAIWTII